MAKRIFLTAGTAGLMAGTALWAALTGCAPDASNQRRVNRERPAVQGQVTVVIQDDYDYYPGYGIYYSRNRHEYVYLDGGAWVRRPEPRGVTVNVLLAAPSVRLDFHDSPEQHHSSVAQSYPRNWTPPGKNRDDKDDRKEERKNDRKADNKKAGNRKN